MSLDGQEVTSLDENYESKLQVIENGINSLLDTDVNDDEQAKEAIGSALDEGFKKWIKTNIAKTDSLKLAIQNFVNEINKEGSKLDKNDFENLIELAQILGISVESLSNNTDVVSNSSKLKFVGDLNSVVDSGEDNVTTVADGLVRVKPVSEDGNSEVVEPEQSKRLYETIDRISEQKGEIESLLNYDLDDDELNSLTFLSNLLIGFERVINNTTVDNVGMLQQFIFENLDTEEKKNAFKEANYDESTQKFNGNFGEKTLGGLNEILDSIEVYITEYKNSSSTDNLDNKESDLDDSEINIELGLVGLEDILKDPNKSEKDCKLYSGLLKEKPKNQDGVEDDSGIKDEVKLYETITLFKNQITDVSDLLENEHLKSNKDLDNLNKLLNNILIIIDFPNRDNVRILQKFIFVNLDSDQEKKDFKSENHFKEKSGFDGQFGISTLKGLNVIKDKVQVYIDKLNDSLKKVEATDNAGDNSGDEFHDSGESSSDNHEDASGGVVNTKPMCIDNASYLVISPKDSEALSRSCGYSDAMFYSTKPVDNPQVLADGTYPAGEFEFVNGERVCYMQLPNHPEAFYKVKFDADGNLCPIATEYSKIYLNNGKYAESHVLIGSNESCINYLYGKLPDAICDSGIEIGWSRRKNDYYLKSFGFNGHTIEPISMAGDGLGSNISWVSSDISKNLAFINLANFLRSSYARKDGGDISYDYFGLGDATPDEKSKFRDYCNHSGWSWDWDRIKNNYPYKKIIL